MPEEPGPDEPTPDARPDVALSTIAKEWGRIGCTGFGGPPTHIAMLRRLAVQREGMAGRDRVRGRHRSHEPPPGPGVDAARHLLCLAPARSAGSAGRRGLLHLPRAGRHHPPGGRLPGGEPAHVGRGRRAGRRGSRRRGGRQRRPRPHSRQLAPDGRPAGPARPLGALRRRGRRGGGHRGGLPGPRPGRLRPGRGGRVGPATATDAAARAHRGGAVGRRGRGRRVGRSRLGRPEGGCAVVRRGLRDRPAHAGRCGAPLPLDDEQPIPERRGAGPDHAGPGGADHRGGRLCGGRRRWGAPGGPHRVHAFVPLHRRRSPTLRRVARQSPGAVLPERRRPGRHRGHRGRIRSPRVWR